MIDIYFACFEIVVGSVNKEVPIDIVTQLKETGETASNKSLYINIDYYTGVMSSQTTDMTVKS